MCRHWGSNCHARTAQAGNAHSGAGPAIAEAQTTQRQRQQQQQPQCSRESEPTNRQRERKAGRHHGTQSGRQGSKHDARATTIAVPRARAPQYSSTQQKTAWDLYYETTRDGGCVSKEVCGGAILSLLARLVLGGGLRNNLLDDGLLLNQERADHPARRVARAGRKTRDPAAAQR